MEMTIELSSREEALALFGLEDRNLKQLRDLFGVRVAAREDRVRIDGDTPRVERAVAIMNSVLSHLRSGTALPDDWIEREIERSALEFSLPPGRGDGAAAGVSPGRGDDAVVGVSAAVDRAVPDTPLAGAAVLVGNGDHAPGPRGVGQAERDDRPQPGRPLSARERALVETLGRTSGQSSYVEAMLRNELVFCLGPAGTGKTFLAVHLAVHYLREGHVNRLILCRPAVEAGEKLGFLPGDFQAKINPYLRPLYDALNDVVGIDQLKRYIEREIIEVVPLAYMRGRTLNNAFIILDEGQNTSVSQMKMFLTRMGAHSRIVVNGDVTQIDLPSGQLSGLIHARRVVQRIAGVRWCHLQREDIVRHRLVQEIVDAYESEHKGRMGDRRNGEEAKET